MLYPFSRRTAFLFGTIGVYTFFERSFMNKVSLSKNDENFSDYKKVTFPSITLRRLDLSFPLDFLLQIAFREVKVEVPGEAAKYQPARSLQEEDLRVPG